MSKSVSKISFILGMMLISRIGFAANNTIRVDVAVDRQEVAVGESFLLQVQIENHDAPSPPDMSSITDFSVQELGGQRNNSTSISVINGQMQRIERRGYFFNYRLSAQKTGVLEIPSLTIIIDGKTYRTRSIHIRVLPPRETEDTQLRLTLSKKTCYVGEPILLTTVWYVGVEARSPVCTISFLESDAFYVDRIDPAQDPRRRLFRMPVNSGEVLATQGEARLGNNHYVTLTFNHVLIPRRPGEYKLDDAYVSAELLVGRTQRRSIFNDDFFSGFMDDDMFGFGGRSTYRTYVASAPSVTLQVMPLPTEGRPVDFTGLVGEYEVALSAQPLEVNVGDPITLEIKISGPPYLGHVEIPPLDKQLAMAEAFRIPTEMAPGRIESNTKVFVQTIRPLSTDVIEIPPLELPYFDTQTGGYCVARSKPIPLKVKPTRILTSSDVEGSSDETHMEQITWRQEGIAHNYTGKNMLQDQAPALLRWVESPVYIYTFWGSSALWAGLALGVLIHKKRMTQSVDRMKKHAYSHLNMKLRQISRQKPDKIIEETRSALRVYLGKRLDLTPGALTYRDVCHLLPTHGVSDETLVKLKTLLDAFEAYQYAGTWEKTEEERRLIEDTRNVAACIEKEWIS